MSLSPPRHPGHAKKTPEHAEHKHGAHEADAKPKALHSQENKEHDHSPAKTLPEPMAPLASIPDNDRARERGERLRQDAAAEVGPRPIRSAGSFFARLFGRTTPSSERISREIKEEQGNEFSDIHEPLTPIQGVGENNTRSDPAIIAVRAELERLKANVTALSESRKVSSERFLHLSEEIGSLRQSIIMHEREMREVAARADKTSGLVASVQPEALFAETKRIEAQYKQQLARADSQKEILDKALAEMRDLRTVVGRFRGIEEAVKLSEDANRLLRENQGLADRVAGHANRIETIYGEVSARFDRFQQVEAIGKEIRQDGERMKKELEDIRKQTEDVASHKEVNEKIGEFAEASELTMRTITELKKEIALLHSHDDETREQLTQAEQTIQRLGSERPPQEKNMGVHEELQARLAALEHHAQEARAHIRHSAAPKPEGAGTEAALARVDQQIMDLGKRISAVETQASREGAAVQTLRTSASTHEHELRERLATAERRLGRLEQENLAHEEQDAQFVQELTAYTRTYLLSRMSKDEARAYLEKFSYPASLITKAIEGAAAK